MSDVQSHSQFSSCLTSGWTPKYHGFYSVWDMHHARAVSTSERAEPEEV